MFKKKSTQLLFDTLPCGGLEQKLTRATWGIFLRFVEVISDDPTRAHRFSPVAHRRFFIPPTVIWIVLWLRYGEPDVSRRACLQT